MKFLIDEDIPVKLLKELIAPVIIPAFQKLLQSLSPEKFKGLLILLESGNIRVLE